MNGIYKVAIRLCALHSLIFFSTCLLLSCRATEKDEITIRWQDKRATGISIPNQMAKDLPADSVANLLTVRLTNETTAIAGQYQHTDEAIVFEPVVPFTRGLRYGVWLRNKRLHEFTIPALPSGDRPALVAIYPSPDTLPVNLLKVYLRFSRPMREGQAQQYVSLLTHKGDTLPGTFLDLKPELWNADRTMLTLWLDPGRIKRDLQPNQHLGAPLQPDNRYRLVISGNWPDEQGATLGKPVLKTFVTTSRDSLSPKPARWAMQVPESGSRQPLEAAFGESLDYYLLTGTLHIFRENGKAVAGTWHIGEDEKKSLFTPAAVWQPGRYRMRIEAKLEDLAGNNLNRPFDRYIPQKPVRQADQPFTELTFDVR